MTDFLSYVNNFDLVLWVAQFGDNPLVATWAVISHGGWIIFIYVIFLGARSLFLQWRQGIFASKRTFVLLAIDVPKATEQTVKAVENMFSHMAGGHNPPTFLEKWWDGSLQDLISCEIISMEGHIQYLIRTTRKLRDMVEASIYAQYPDAELTEVEDYASKVPDKYPDDEYECYGLEMMMVKPDPYPLKTYIDFEDKLTGEFKDPLAVLLEAFSRMGPGEQCWYQVLLTPISQGEFVESAIKVIKKITGQKEEMKKTLVDHALDLPMMAMGAAGDVMFGAPESTTKKKDENALNSRMWNLTPGERKVVEAIELKMSKIIFKVKIRFMYIAKKEVFTKSKILQSFIGAMKQLNTNDMQAIKLETKKVGVSSGLVFFKTKRNNKRKERLVAAYRARSDWRGLDRMHMSVAEIATLWHLPVSLFVKAPQVKKTESKKSEPPINLPLG
jgi:hypothetical protein